MRVTVLLFAHLRQAADRSRIELELPDDATVRAAADRIEREIGTALAGSMCAVNERYAAPATLLADGDVVAFLPPVSGG